MKQWGAKLRGRWAKPLFYFFLFYLGSYTLLSAFGAYRLVFTGRFLDLRSPLFLNDRSVWCPAFIKHKRYVFGGRSLSANIPGYFYHPLVVLDREFIHPSSDYNWEQRMWVGIQDHYSKAEGDASLITPTRAPAHHKSDGGEGE